MRVFRAELERVAANAQKEIERVAANAQKEKIDEILAQVGKIEDSRAMEQQDDIHRNATLSELKAGAAYVRTMLDVGKAESAATQAQIKKLTRATSVMSNQLNDFRKSRGSMGDLAQLAQLERRSFENNFWGEFDASIPKRNVTTGQKFFRVAIMGMEFAPSDSAGTPTLLGAAICNASKQHVAALMWLRHGSRAVVEGH